MNITGGIYKGRKIQAPSENTTRPTLSKAREGVFSSLFSLIDFENKSFLDLFAGSGIMGLEALSRGFDVCFVEKNLKVTSVLKRNFSSLNIHPQLFTMDATKFLNSSTQTFDVIYIDPPYKSDLYEKSLDIIYEKNILNDNGIIIVEHDSQKTFDKFKIIKQKTYSNKFVTFLEKII